MVAGMRVPPRRSRPPGGITWGSRPETSRTNRVRIRGTGCHQNSLYSPSKAISSIEASKFAHSHLQLGPIRPPRKSSPLSSLLDFSDAPWLKRRRAGFLLLSTIEYKSASASASWPCQSFLASQETRQSWSSVRSRSERRCLWLAYRTPSFETGAVLAGFQPFADGGREVCQVRLQNAGFPSRQSRGGRKRATRDECD